MFKPPSDFPKQKNGGHRPRGIDQHIEQGGLPGGHERLMELVAGRIESRKKNGESCIRPVPPFNWNVMSMTQRPENQKGQDGVFDGVTALAKHKLDFVDGFIRNVRVKPAEDGPDDARSVLHRAQIR